MRKFRIPYIPYRSLLLSTTVLNDIYIYVPAHRHSCNTFWPESSQTSYQLVGILGYPDQVSFLVEWQLAPSCWLHLHTVNTLELGSSILPYMATHP